MQDVEAMSQLRLERDTMHTQLSLLNSKLKKLNEENTQLKDRVEDARKQAKINLESANYEISVDLSTKSATRSVPRIELEY